MQIDTLLFARQDDGCIDQCPPPLPCTCSANQECIIINRQVRSTSSLHLHFLIHLFLYRDCHTCSQTTCITAKPAQKPSGGISKGALAGGIVAAVLLLALSISLYFWFRRKSRIRKILVKNHEDKPAAAEDVLNRPDPSEKLSAPPQQQQPPYPSTSHHHDIESRGSSLPPPPPRSQLVNPFDDSHSIQTARTEGPNVIPIALVSPEPYHGKTDTDSLPSSTSSGPVRPARSPDLNLNLDHVNVSHDNLRMPYANSVISGISGISGASYTSDFLNEAPVIVTANTRAVRQVINVVKAEVVNPGAISPPLIDGGLKPPPSFSSRPANKSPLAATSFGPNDVLSEADESANIDPFHDTHSTTAQGSTSPAIEEFDQGSPRPDSLGSNWAPNVPTLPWARSDDSRPSSISTQAGSVVNIGSATRVNVGLSGFASPATASTIPSAPYRNTMGRLISPSTGGSSQLGTLQDQQARAFAQAHGSKRVSGSSVVSAASTRADSILEAFPFVPPSPISDRPIRSPPISPLGKQSFTPSPKLPFVQPTVTIAPASPLNQQAFKASDETATDSALPAPPNRRTLGLSTGSQLSTTSTGLGSFPFQIDSGAGDVNNNNQGSRPNTLSIRQRASLDTLALTSDLASYPLDFERDSMPPPPSR